MENNFDEVAVVVQLLKIYIVERIYAIDRARHLMTSEKFSE